LSDNLKNLSEFIEIVRRLRAPGGCPWDREQTHESLKPFLIEETYEVLEAIDSGDSEHLKEELGDLLLQVVLHAQLADDQKEFNIDDVAQLVSEKMVRRHPHVFGDTQADTADAVKVNWEEIKNKEKNDKGITNESILDSVPKNFPALYENHKISKKVAKIGFDWKKPSDVFEKISEEISEVKDAIETNDSAQIEEELGDLLFATANLCRSYKVNPELALKNANNKFRKRFSKMENIISKENLETGNIDFDKWNELWELCK